MKTEHSGAKHGKGAFWGKKKDAKKYSKKPDAKTAKRLVRQRSSAVEQSAHIRRVPGSNPGAATTSNRRSPC